MKEWRRATKTSERTENVAEKAVNVLNRRKKATKTSEKTRKCC